MTTRFFRTVLPLFSLLAFPARGQAPPIVAPGSDDYATHYVTPLPAPQPASENAEFDPYAHRTVRPYLGISGLGTFALNQSGANYLDVGGGFAARAGLDLGSILGIEASYTASFHNPAFNCVDAGFLSACDAQYLVIQILAADLILHVPTGTPLVPYLQAGGSAAWIGKNGFFADAGGGGFEAGGGIDIWLDENWTFGTKILYRGLWFDQSQRQGFLGTSNFLGLLTVDLNLALHF